MFCRACGHKLVEGVRFCPYCGEPTEDVATDEEPAELIDDQNSDPVASSETTMFAADTPQSEIALVSGLED